MSHYDKTRILFVCMGNICRSPAGENVMRHLVKDTELESKIELDSAGTINFHTGKSPDSRMQEAATNRSIPMVGRARQVTAQDFETFDWILAMDEDNYHDLQAIQEGVSNPRAELRLFCDFCTEHSESEVPDPYYGGAEGFETVLDLLEDGCAGFLKEIIA